jgi:hypothetical protein
MNRSPTAARRVNIDIFEEEFTFIGFPPNVLDALRGRRESEAIQLARAAGFRDENTLTDLVFFGRHPERDGAPLRRDEPAYAALATEWLAIRDRLVRAAPPVNLSPYVPAPPTAAPGARPRLSTTHITNSTRALLTPQIEAAVRALDAEFRNDGLKVTLTSALRTPQDQLRLIREQAVKRGLDRLYPSILNATVDNVESWIDAWDDLLHRQKYVINPPVDACSRIVPGKCYGPSPHSSGLAFDLSGADLDRVAEVVRGYCQRGGPLRQILIERKNNAVHVGIDSAGRSGNCQITSR